MRLIDADALKTAIDNGWKPDMMVTEIWDIIDEMLAIEAEPVRHGHWEYKSDYEAELCTNCKCISPFQFNYCPHCGAKIDEVSE